MMDKQIALFGNMNQTTRQTRGIGTSLSYSKSRKTQGECGTGSQGLNRGVRIIHNNSRDLAVYHNTGVSRQCRVPNSERITPR